MLPGNRTEQGIPVIAGFEIEDTEITRIVSFHCSLTSTVSIVLPGFLSSLLRRSLATKWRCRDAFNFFPFLPHPRGEQEDTKDAIDCQQGDHSERSPRDQPGGSRCHQEEDGHILSLLHERGQHRPETRELTPGMRWKPTKPIQDKSPRAEKQEGISDGSQQ